MKLWTTLTGDVACKAIRGIGFEFSPRELRLQLRGDCWAVWIPGGYMAWFPVNDQGLERLNVERKVLGLLHRRCRFEVPRICFESASGFDVRIVVPGRHDPLRWYNRALSNDFIARRIGVDLGEILAEQHTAISKVDVEGWIPERALWPGPAALMRDKLRYVIENAELFEQLTRAYQCYENTIVSHDDCVLTHTDLGFHNFSIFESTGCISGVFDYKAAAWADRHHDFRCLTDVEETLESAVATYELKAGQKLSRKRIWLYGAACVIDAIANRRGFAPDEKPDGRTLEEDLSRCLSKISRAEMQ